MLEPDALKHHTASVVFFIYVLHKLLQGISKMLSCLRRCHPDLTATVRAASNAGTPVRLCLRMTVRPGQAGEGETAGQAGPSRPRTRSPLRIASGVLRESETAFGRVTRDY